MWYGGVVWYVELVFIIVYVVNFVSDFGWYDLGFIYFVVMIGFILFILYIYFFGR